jgi:hypothetical protein
MCVRYLEVGSELMSSSRIDAFPTLWQAAIITTSIGQLVHGSHAKIVKLPASGSILSTITAIVTHDDRYRLSHDMNIRCACEASTIKLASWRWKPTLEPDEERNASTRLDPSDFTIRHPSAPRNLSTYIKPPPPSSCKPCTWARPFYNPHFSKSSLKASYQTILHHARRDKSRAAKYHSCISRVPRQSNEAHPATHHDASKRRNEQA